MTKMLKELGVFYRGLLYVGIAFFLFSQVFDYFDLSKWSRAFFFFGWVMFVVLTFRVWWLNLVKFRNWLKSGK